MCKAVASRGICILMAVVLFIELFAGCGGNTGNGSTSNPTLKEATEFVSETSTQAQISGKNNQDNISDNVTVWTWDTAGEGSVISAFNKAYPNINVDIVPIGHDDYLNRVQTTIAAGSDIGDILCVEMGYRGRLMSMDILENLEQPPYNFDRSKVLDYVPSISSFNGKVVGVDDSINSSGLAYKAELAKQYLGTDDPDELEKMLPTWDAFVEKGREVQAKSNGRVFLISCWADLQEYFDNFGTEPYTIDNRVTDFTLNTRAAERYTLLKAMMGGRTFDKSVQGHYTPANNASYTQDNHIFYLCATWGIYFILKSNDPHSKGRWRIMQAPGGPFNQGGTLRSIWKGSRNKKNAWTYINYAYNSVEGGEQTVKARNYYIPYKPFLEQYDFSKDLDPYFGTQNVYEKYVKQMAPMVRVRVPEVYQSQIYDSYAAVENAVLSDEGNTITLDMYKEMLKTQIQNKCPDLEW